MNSLADMGLKFPTLEAKFEKKCQKIIQITQFKKLPNHPNLRVFLLSAQVFLVSYYVVENSLHVFVKKFTNQKTY